MVEQLVSKSFQRSAAGAIEYPESDGLPLADNTLQFRLITTIHGGLDALLADAFVAADLLWYPVEGDNTTSTAPDVMVALGRPKGERRSYKQWEEGNIAPQVVFEIASSSNTLKELEDKKFKFYRQHGVEEYYLYDPERQTLKGWLRDGESLPPIAETSGWVSPRLGVRFELEDGELQLYRPDGRRFATYAEIEARAEQAEARAARLAQRLRELGVDPDELL